jgi:diaminobutyrate-2-oxoglutarate transaminase
MMEQLSSGIETRSVASNGVESNGLESSVRSYCRLFSATFKRAHGSHLWDTSGREYIDLFSGAGALNYGHNPHAIRDRLIDYLMHDGVTHSLDMLTESKEAFMADFARVILTPRQLEYHLMFSGPTGANVVEAAMKLARKVTGRANIASFTNGFHGMSLGALSATGSMIKRRGAGIPLGLVDRYPFDGYFGTDIDTIEWIAKLLDDPSSGFDPPAAFLVETVQGEGGVNTATNDWLKRLAAVAERYKSLLIVDDIQAGCGRTGTFFSFESAGIYPDLVCLSKSISGYGFPMSLLLIKPDHDIWSPGEHNGTFRGNNLAFVAGRAALSFWTSNEFHAVMSDNIQILDRWLSSIQDELPAGNVTARGRGLMRGLAFSEPSRATAAARKAFENGVIIEVSGGRDDVLKFLPPLNIERDVFQEALMRLSAIVCDQQGSTTSKLN